MLSFSFLHIFSKFEIDCNASLMKSNIFKKVNNSKCTFFKKKYGIYIIDYILLINNNCNHIFVCSLSHKVEYVRKYKICATV